MLRVLFLLLAMPLATFAQASDFSEREKVALAELRENKLAGAAIAIVKGEQVIYAKGFGAANVENGESVKPEMLFRSASVGKTLTSAATLTLVEQGKIKLDEPVGTYLKGLCPKLARVTPHQLMSHTAGLRDLTHAFVGPYDEAQLGVTVRDVKDEDFLAEPGEIFSYSSRADNTGIADQRGRKKQLRR